MTRTHRCTASFRPRLECLEDRAVPSTTALAVVPNPGTMGQAVTLTATIAESGADYVPPGTGVHVTGHVTFYDGSTPLGTVAVKNNNSLGTSPQGTAVFTTSALTAGSHSLWATYTGEQDILLYQNTAGSTSGTVNEVINIPLARVAIDAFYTAGGLMTGNPYFYSYGVADYLSLYHTTSGTAQQQLVQAYATDLWIATAMMSSQP
jgi:hypothetical protein